MGSSPPPITLNPFTPKKVLISGIRFKMSSICLPTSSVLSKEEAAGSCTETMKYPSSSSGIKVVGHFTKSNNAIAESTRNEPIAVTGRTKSHFTERLYACCIPSLNLSNHTKSFDFCLGVGFNKIAQSAGESVNELIPLNTVDAAMVKANCLYNCPVMPLINVVGMNTAKSTNTTPIIGPVISLIAFSVICRMFTFSPFASASSSKRVTFSTTTIASSTTIAIANTKPNKVNVLIENPNADMIANVPISETGMVIQGISTARQLCKKKNITSTTKIVASMNVFNTSLIESCTTSVVSSVT